jgi:exodeoxyribonuclease VII small subunit
MNAQQPSFEESQRELERIVERLERGDVELEELTQLWQRGEELYRRCAEQLSEAQGRIEELARQLDAASSDGNARMAP